tara:strand:- start:59961 stop:60791 length:831 start_codon:yes stop_codon:yes gene_type:complete
MKRILIKFFKYLAKPHKLPKKIIDKLSYYSSFKKYNQKLYIKEQNKIFSYYSLNRKEGIRKLNEVKNKLLLNFNEDFGLSSEHEIIFSSLSLKKNIKRYKILEIGTYDGFNARLLSNLFPNSVIDTIDLPEDDKDFVNFYNRKDQIDIFIKNRDSILSQMKNINFYSLNSLKLLNSKKKYDLIWIDGAHGYPIVCIDIINSLHILKNDGLILCDDIVTNISHFNSTRMYRSIASYETLNELKKQKIINFKLAYKRINAENNCVEKERKFIAIVNKI